ncbi:anticodon binding domain protein [Ancylostoma duodenale]|uniref:Anticodon binding domain protein n=1 Tax=Ancylostoma duodenale TaxID=51022 RepID=A0A0C2E078_9BILA|nr:anticodon binding domain protein [Ancylostoma duodenale]
MWRVLAFLDVPKPVSVASIPYARMIQHQLAEADYEVRADLTCVGSLNRRIKNAIITKCNFILVVGMNEATNGTVLGEFTVGEVMSRFRSFVNEFSNDSQCTNAFATSTSEADPCS